VKTKHLSLVTQQHLDTPREKSNASSPYGPVRAGLTTSQITPEARLTELLNSLESAVDSLNYKSFVAYDTLNTAMENLRVVLSNIVTEEDGTDTL
jgi:hypothetical protein